MEQWTTALEMVEIVPSDEEQFSGAISKACFDGIEAERSTVDGVL